MYDDLVKILNGLKEYTLKHFSEEIALMESINYPRLDLHKEAHKGFVEKLDAFEIDADKISLGTQDQMILDLMDYLLEEEKYLYKFADMVRLYLKDTYPEPKTHEFIVMANYNQMIDSMVEEFVKSEITKIV